jgi:hypothetical protein
MNQEDNSFITKNLPSAHDALVVIWMMTKKKRNAF